MAFGNDSISFLMISNTCFINQMNWFIRDYKTSIHLAQLKNKPRLIASRLAINLVDALSC